MTCPHRPSHVCWNPLLTPLVWGCAEAMRCATELYPKWLAAVAEVGAPETKCRQWVELLSESRDVVLRLPLLLETMRRDFAFLVDQALASSSEH